MFLSPWNLIQAILFVLGLWWCKEIASRFRDDLAKLREPDDQADRVVIIILWIVSVFVLLICLGFAWNITWSIVRGISALWK